MDRKMEKNGSEIDYSTRERKIDLRQSVPFFLWSKGNIYNLYVINKYSSLNFDLKHVNEQRFSFLQHCKSSAKHGLKKKRGRASQGFNLIPPPVPLS